MAFNLKVTGSDGSAEEEVLHGGAVRRDEVGEQVQVPGDEYWPNSLACLIVI